MKILGYTYRVVEDADSDAIGAYGRHLAKKHIIQIASDLPTQQKESTVLHEIIEALSYYLELGLAHSVIMSLEASLYQVLTDNGVSLAPLAELIEKECSCEKGVCK